MLTYRWASGSHFRGDAAPVFEALQAMQNESAEAIVDAAAAPEHAFHPHIFRETDTEAAHEYRLSLARSMVRSIIVVEREKEDGPATTRRAFYFVQPERSDDEGPTAAVVVSEATVRATPAWRAQIVSRLLMALRAAQRELAQFRETPLVKSLPGIIEQAEEELAEATK